MTLPDWQGNRPGVYDGLPEEAYHGNKEAISSSLLRWEGTPAHLEWKLSHPEPEESIELFIGTCVHSSVLEGRFPCALVRRPPDVDLRTKEGKAWVASQGDKRILKPEEFDAIMGCTLELCEHPFVTRNVRPARKEVSLLAQRDGYMAKCRIDIVPPGVTWLADIKTTREGEASPEGFQRTMSQRNYHAQARWYLDLWNELHPDDQRNDFVFIVVEKSPPYAVGIYRVSQEALEAGRRFNDERLATLLRCRETGVWPGYSEDPVTVELPKWRNG